MHAKQTKPITKGFTNYTGVFQLNIKQYFNYLSKTLNTATKKCQTQVQTYFWVCFFAKWDSENYGEFPLETSVGWSWQV